MNILGVQSPQNLSKPYLFDEPDLPRTRGVEFWRYNMTIMQQYNMCPRPGRQTDLCRHLQRATAGGRLKALKPYTVLKG